MGLYHDIDIVIKNFNLCNDVMEMLRIYDALNIRYILKNDILHIYKTKKKHIYPHCEERRNPYCHSEERRISSEDINITINESGTCLRFVLPYFAFVYPKNVVIQLGDRLAKRPISKLIDCLNEAGADVILNGNIIKITPPPSELGVGSEELGVQLPTPNSQLPTIIIDSSQSSQFLSSLMMLSTKKNIQIQIKNQIASESYLKMTEDVIKLFCHTDHIPCHSERSEESHQMKIDCHSERSEESPRCFVPQHDNRSTPNSQLPTPNSQLPTPNSQLPTPHSQLPTPNSINLTLDPDYSTICYFWLYSFLTKKQISVKKISNIYQPDYHFIDILKKIGFVFIENNDSITLDCTVHSPLPTPNSQLSTINCSNVPDQIITLSFLALFLKNKTYIQGCHTLFSKESNRIKGILHNIKLLGGEACYKIDTLCITPLKNEPKKCCLKTYNDHRFALTFYMLSQRFHYLEIDNIDCAKKSIDINSLFKIMTS